MEVNIKQIYVKMYKLNIESASICEKYCEEDSSIIILFRGRIESFSDSEPDLYIARTNYKHYQWCKFSTFMILKHPLYTAQLD